MFSLVMRMNPQLRCRFQANIASKSTNHCAAGVTRILPTNSNSAIESAHEAVFNPSDDLIHRSMEPLGGK